MQSGLRGLDELIVASGQPPQPPVPSRHVALVVEIGESSTTADFVAAATLRTELAARLADTEVEMWVLGDDPVTHNWIGEGIHHVDVAALPAMASATDAVVAWGTELSEVSAVSVAEVAPPLDPAALLHLAGHAWARGHVRAANPFRSVDSYVAVMADRDLELSRLHAAELVRFAQSRDLELVLVRDGTDPGSGDLQAARAAIAAEGLDATLGVDAGGVVQMLGAMAGAAVVVTMSHETGELARAYHPRISVLDRALDVGPEMQRQLHAALDRTPAAPRRDVAEQLDQVARATAQAVAAASTDLGDRDLAHELLEARLVASRQAQSALLGRLLEERERAVAAQARLWDRVAVAEAGREAALADADLARESARRQQAHLNALEVRVADLDQGPVAPPTPSIPLRLFNVFERVLFAVARRVRRRLTGA